jgi:hypothetical protein
VGTGVNGANSHLPMTVQAANLPLENDTGAASFSKLGRLANNPQAQQRDYRKAAGVTI